MTVRELIEALSTLNPDLHVVVPSPKQPGYGAAQKVEPGWFQFGIGAFEASGDDELADAVLIST